MDLFQIICISLVGIATILHLIACFIENETFRALTKPLCMAFAVLTLVSFHVTSVFIYLGASLALLGDILLLRRSSKLFFMLGTVSFYLSHISYAIYLSTHIENRNYLTFNIIIGLIIWLAITLVGGYLIRNKVRKINYIGASYFGIMTIVLLLFTGQTSLYKLIGVGGILMHILSDTILAYTTFFNKQTKRKHFYIMLTYLPAQYLMLVALLLI